MIEKTKLDSLRAEIDEIDSNILKLVNRRLQIAKAVGETKSAAPGAAFYVPEREEKIIRRLIAENDGLLDRIGLERLFREIISLGRATETLLRVAYLGPEGTYSQSAVLKQFGHAVDAQSETTIDEVFRAVETGRADFGVVPVENTIEGGVNTTLDRLVETPLKVCAEVNLKVHHCLLGKQESLGGISRVFAHSQTLAQCRRWLGHHLPQAAIKAVESNAEAARQAAADESAVAIAADIAAEIYSLNILEQNIEDRPGNTTRFMVIGEITTRSTGNDKTSIVLSGQNRPGALYALLQPLDHHGISMTRIESRPSRTGLWEYVFFVDFDGHVEDDNVRLALSDLEKEAGLLKQLGSYPKALSSTIE